MSEYLKSVSGQPGSGSADIKFTSGATSTDIQCAQFFMTMEDRGMSLDEMRAYAKVGPQLSPTVDWDEINRVLQTYA